MRDQVSNLGRFDAMNELETSFFRRVGMELCADGLGDAFLDEAEQFAFDVMAGELE